MRQLLFDGLSIERSNGKVYVADVQIGTVKHSRDRRWCAYWNGMEVVSKVPNYQTAAICLSYVWADLTLKDEAAKREALDDGDVS